MELDTLSSDEFRAAHDLGLAAGDRGAALVVRWGTGQNGKRAVQARTGLHRFDRHIGHPVLQCLKAADGHTELFARLEVVGA
ncbi:hypothetical protein D3C85_1658550 [compost metagenome]